MLGFGKKKNKGEKEKDKGQKSKKPEPENKKSPSKKDTAKGKDNKDGDKDKKGKLKKLFSKKLIIGLLLVLIALGASAFVVYTFYFSDKASTGDEENPVYVSKTLEHITLPEEILKFSFDHFQKLYFSMVEYNSEIVLIDQEIMRIDSIAEQYPDQIKIAEKEKKVWEKTRSKLEKVFLKLEKPVKETFVLFRVNEASGLIKIEEKYPELTEIAKSALLEAQEMTEKLKSRGTVPKGFIKGNIYKLKKKFL